MKVLIFASVILVASNAAPSPGILAPIAPVALTATPVLAVPANVASQYHSQDGFGHYAYGYSNDLSAKNEIKQLDGSIVGSYSYVDAEGQIQNVQYRSDDIHGFRVSATNLPVAPVPTEIVKVALPQPIQDTPEVVQARFQHLAAVKEAEKSTKIEPEQKSAESEQKSAEPEQKSAEPEQKSAVPTTASPEPTASAKSTESVHSQSTPAGVVRTALPAVGVVHPAPLVTAPAFAYSYVHLNPYVAQPIISTYHVPVFAQSPSHLTTDNKQEIKDVAGETNQLESVAVESARSAPQIAGVAPFVPEFTPEVAKARAEHLEAVEKIKKDVAKE